MPPKHDPGTTPHGAVRKALLGMSVLALSAASLVACEPSHDRLSTAQPAPPLLLSLVPALPAPVAEPVPHLRMESAVAPAHLPDGAMPTGDLHGWKQVVAQDFLGRTVPGGWGTYEGQPGGNPYGYWLHNRVVPTGDDLRLHGSWIGNRFTTGGLMQLSAPQTYGKYEVRFKVDKGAGVSYALLLWPATGRWPEAGEIDFAEDGGGNRSRTTATLHYGAGNTQVQHLVKADFSQFQTVGVEWTPGKLVYTLNGKPWASVLSSQVPSGPMNLALQLEAGHGTAWSDAPSRATPANVDLTVDWVVAYARS